VKVKSSGELWLTTAAVGDQAVTQLPIVAIVGTHDRLAAYGEVTET